MSGWLGRWTAAMRGRRNRRPTILVVTSDLEIGGGQAFAVRIANALAREMRVLVMGVDPAKVDPTFASRVGPDAELIESSADPTRIREIVSRERVTAVNSHLWWADKVVFEAIRGLDVRWLVSMHGCYDMLIDQPHVEPRFRELASAVLERANRVAIAAEKNRRVFEQYGLSQVRVERVPYGYEPMAPTRVERPDADVVFGVVSRAVPNKGWHESVEAFTRVRAELAREGRRAALVLLGGGPLVDELRARRDVEGLVVPGWADRPQDWIAGFDVGMLPSSFPGESLPNAIIEYLAQSKPVIGTRWAEIPAMLGEGADAAGVLIPVRGDAAEVPALAEAMLALARDEALRERARRNAPLRFRAFSMPTCVEHYRRLLIG
ncbi:MAG: glycosyltransferase family 4 protein [Phycisphaerales bacterium]